jgi:hypothetical protein
MKYFKYQMGALKAAMPPFHCWDRPGVKENIHVGRRFCQFAGKKPLKSEMRPGARLSRAVLGVWPKTLPCPASKPPHLNPAQIKNESFLTVFPFLQSATPFMLPGVQTERRES